MFGEETSKYYQQYLLNRSLIDLMNYTPEDFQFDFSIYLGGIYSAEASIRGKGFGQVMSQLIRAITYNERERARKSIH